MAEEKVQVPAETTSIEKETAPAPAQKSKEEGIELEGKVVESVKGKFRVEIPSKTPDGKPHYVLAHIAGKLRHNFIKIVQGDRVKVEVSPYDLNRGRITFRLKG